MDGKGKAIQVRQKIKVNGALTDALPYNTVDEVYVDPDSNTMLREKLLNIDNTIKTTSAENTKLTGTIVTVETKISDIESNIGSGGNISQEISTIKTEIEEVKQKLNTSYTSALENENRLNVLVNKHQNHKNNKITNLNGVHGVRYVNDVLSYRDNDMNWHEVKSGGDELELIKQALSGQISKNQFIHRRANCTITGGCYKNGKYFINTPVFDEKKYRTMTVIIDQNDPNPMTRCTYADDAVGMTPGSSEWDEFFGHFPCLFKNGEIVGVLDRTNRTRFEDGRPADITSGSEGDVMIAIPRNKWKMFTDVNNKLHVSVTNDLNKEDGFESLSHTRSLDPKDYFFIGAYTGSLVNGKLRSLSGKTPLDTISLSQARQYAQANGPGYEQLMFHPLTYLQIMYLLKYRDTDPQVTIGRGYVDNNSKALITGGTETKPMDWGETTGKQHMILFGVEDIYGNVYQWVDGLYSDAQRNILTSSDKFNDAASGYINRGKATNININGYVDTVQGTTTTGFIPKTVNGSIKTHYAVSSCLYPSRLPIFGGMMVNDNASGLFMYQINYISSSTSDQIGARLMFL